MVKVILRITGQAGKVFDTIRLLDAKAGHLTIGELEEINKGKEQEK